MKNFFSILLFFSLAGLTLTAQTIITGRILGYNEKPLLRADVHISSPLTKEVFFSIKAKKNGSYRIELRKNGYYFLEYTGANNQRLKIPIIINKSKRIKLNIVLKHNQYLPTFKKVQIIGDFNNFDIDKPVTMKKQSDGTYTAEFETTRHKFAYQLIGIEYTGRIINGTESDSFIYDGDGDYESVVISKNGKVKITFNPKKLVRINNAEQITFDIKNYVDKEAYNIITSMGQRQNRIILAVNNNKGKLPKNFNWSKDIKKVQDQISKEKNPLLKKLSLLSYLELGVFGAKNIDGTIAKQAFEEIKPNSIIWAVDPRALELSYGFTGYKGNPGYVNKVISSNPNREVVGFSLYLKTMQAKMVGNVALAKQTYNELVGNYGDTQFGKIAKASPLVTDISPGNLVPHFSVTSIDDPAKVITNESLRKHIYLIDFWASWSKPCLNEMPNLQAAYEKYKDKGFEILSLSFDKKLEDVKKFRSGKWKMPWLNAFIQDGFGSLIAKKFGVTSIPYPILVDKNGKIIATSVQLRGPNLMRTLYKVFENQNK